MILYLAIVGLFTLGGLEGNDVVFPSEKQCSTSSRGGGNCIKIEECQSLSGIVGKHPLTPEASNILRDLQCGFEYSTPKICCPIETVTPSTSTSETTTAALLSDATKHANFRLLNHQICGPIIESKVIIGGGNITELFEFPWMALIRYEVGKKRTLGFRCGGSLISKSYVLTAAHCVTGLPGLRLHSVRLGEHDLRTEIDCTKHDYPGSTDFCAERYQDFSIEAVHYHPQYDKSKLQHDIALLRINGEAMYSRSVRPICLPIEIAETARISKAIVTGWGVTETGFRSDVLLKAELSIVPFDVCAAEYANQKLLVKNQQSSRQPIEILPTQLCARGKRGVDSCSGDSGGPLQVARIYLKMEPRFVQYGVVSYGPVDCGDGSFPAVHTGVAYYLTWILDTMKD